MQLHKHYLAILLSASLTGCLSGGGSFDVEEVNPTKIINNPADKKVTYKQAEKPNPEDFSEMGATFNSPVPKTMFLSAADIKLFTVDPAGTSHQHIDEDYDTLKIKYPVVIDKDNAKHLEIKEKNINIKIEPNNGNNKKWNYLTKANKNTTYFSGKDLEPNINADFYLDEQDNDVKLKIFGFDHTKVGLAVIRNDITSYKLFNLENILINSIFYRGKNKTTDVPISGTAIYKGFWEFATQLHFSDSSLNGSNSNLTDQNPIDFTVDFGKKTVTGTLKSTTENRKFDYTLNANITGNSFTGNATGKYDFSNSNGNSENSTATISGSFFGPKATELAGKITENQNAWAGVFAAKKENGGTELRTDGDLFQAGVMTFTPPSKAENSSNSNELSEISQPNSATDSTNSQTYTLNTYQKVNYSGNVDKLQVDGVLIDLTQNPDLNKACCSATEKEKNGLTTQAVKFGKYGYTKNSSNETDSENNKVGGYFVQGVLTPTSEVPTTGTAEYDGRWYGYASDSQGTFSGEALDAKFTAKWTEKKLEGKLFNKNQVNKTSLSFDATITENSFKAENTKFEVSTDTAKDAQKSSKITINDVKVEGHFYGKGANELGGHFYSESKKAGGVFGAKQVETGSK